LVVCCVRNATQLKGSNLVAVSRLSRILLTFSYNSKNKCHNK
jgi:hypothetical protein